MGIAPHLVSRSQHHIPIAIQPTIRVAQGHNIHPLIPLHQQIAPRKAHKGRVYRIANLHRIPQQRQVTPRRHLPLQIQVIPRQSHVSLGGKLSPILNIPRGIAQVAAKQRARVYRQQTTLLRGRRTVDPLPQRYPFRRRGVERPLNIQTRILPKHNPIGIDQKQIRRPIHPQRAKNIRQVTPRHPAQDRLNPRRVSKIHPLPQVDIKLQKTMKQIAPPDRPTLDQVG